VFATDAERRRERRIITTRRTARHRAAAQGYKTITPCKDCGGNFHSEAMEFDHCRGTKSFDISRGYGKSLPAIIAEMRKCDLVCSICHRKRTASRRS
jgi:hypothetical protein